MVLIKGMRCTMGLLKLVIVDDEPILLFFFAQSGEQAL